MGKISDTSKYATVTPATGDLIVGTDISDSNNTKTFKVGEIAGLTGEHMEYFAADSGAATTISNNTSFFLLNATTTSNVSSGNLTHTNNRITYTGTETKTFKLVATCNGTTTSNNVIHFAFHKNGTIVTSSEQDTKADGTVVLPTAFQCLVELATDQYVEVFVKNSTGSNNFTLQHINVIATEV
jgi:hypothetical protein